MAIRVNILVPCESIGKPRILLHLTANPYGGVETHVYHLSLALREWGAEVTLTTHRKIDFKEDWCKSLVKAGVKIVAPPRDFRPKLGLMGVPAARLWLLLGLPLHGFDVVLGESHGGAYLWMKRFVSPAGKFLWHDHGDGLPSSDDNFTNYGAPAPQQFSLRMMRLAHSVDGIITGCSRSRENLLSVQRVKCKVAVIPPLSIFPHIPAAHDKVYDDRSVLRLVMVARHGIGKGTGILMDLWNELSIGPAELHLYGPTDEPNLEPWLARASCCKGLFLHGPIDRASLPDVLQSMDIGLFLSIKEGYGLVPVEYMASGLPFLTTDCGASREFTYQNPDALQVPVSREHVKKGIESIVRSVRSNQLSRSRIQERCRRNFSAHQSLNGYREALLNAADFWQKYEGG